LQYSVGNVITNSVSEAKAASSISTDNIQSKAEEGQNSNQVLQDLADIATAKISAVIDKNVEYILSFDQPVSEAIYQAGRSNMLGTLSEMIEFGSPEEKEAAEDALDYLNNQGGFVNFAAACDYLAAAMKNRVGGTYYDEDRTVFDTTSLWQGGYTPIVPPSIFEVGGSTIDPILRLRDPLYIVENIGITGLSQSGLDGNGLQQRIFVCLVKSTMILLKRKLMLKMMSFGLT